MKKILFALFALFNVFMTYAQQTIVLYPEGVPNSNGLEGHERNRDKEFVMQISEPRMEAFILDHKHSNGNAVIICPGGGYSGVAHVKEGSEVARWFNSLGISAFVLYYRMPNGNYDIPLQDAQKAMDILRKNAKAWNIKANKIGIMGFSAGGHLASTVGTHWKNKNHRPAFMILGYPVISMNDAFGHIGSRINLMGKEPSNELKDQFSNELWVNKKTPPTFIFHSRDDQGVPFRNATAFKEALDKNQVQSHLALYNTGGHGYGMRNTTDDCSAWPQELKKWLVAMGFAGE